MRGDVFQLHKAATIAASAVSQRKIDRLVHAYEIDPVGLKQQFREKYVPVVENDVFPNNVRGGLISAQLLHDVCAAWKEQGCQLFCIDQRTLDLAAATIPMDLDDFFQGLDAEGTEVWRLPYNQFAIAFPHPVPIGDDSGHTTTAVIVDAVWGEGGCFWLVAYRRQGKAPTLGDNLAFTYTTKGHLLYEVITNVCFFLNETGTLSRQKNGSSVTKAGKLACKETTAWSASFNQVTNLPLGIAQEFFDKGYRPGHRFCLGKRIMVRGHWRLQPCGPRNQFRKYKWIAPYMKGHEDDPLWTRTYKVTEGCIAKHLGEEP